MTRTLNGGLASAVRTDSDSTLLHSSIITDGRNVDPFRSTDPFISHTLDIQFSIEGGGGERRREGSNLELVPTRLTTTLFNTMFP